jgi:hypothetical protein
MIVLMKPRRMRCWYVENNGDPPRTVMVFEPSKDTRVAFCAQSLVLSWSYIIHSETGGPMSLTVYHHSNAASHNLLELSNQ